jgi:hypothetical protein
MLFPPRGRWQGRLRKESSQKPLDPPLVEDVGDAVKQGGAPLDVAPHPGAALEGGRRPHSPPALATSTRSIATAAPGA